MNLRRFTAISRKEFLHVARDSRSLGMGIAIPVLLLILFGYGLSLDVDHIPLAVLDQDNSPDSREFTAAFSNSSAFDLAENASSQEELESMIQTGAATAGLVLPDGLSSSLASGQGVSIQFVVDGSDANTARLAINYARAIVSSGSLSSRASIITAYNPAMDTTWSIVPGLIAIIVNVIAAMLTSLCVAREWENGTMEQLISTPVRKLEFILGKLSPYYLIGVMDIIIAVLMAVFLFHIPLKGSLLSLAAVSGMFLLGALSVGMLISIAARSQLLASQLSLITTFLPGFLLSGFVYDISAMPVIVTGITRIIPARYFVSLLRAIFLKGAWGSNLSFDVLFLTVFSSGVLLISLKKLNLSLDGR